MAEVFFFPTSYARVVSPDLFVLQWVNRPRYRHVLPNRPIATRRLSLRATAPFFLLLRI